jgi:Sulfatase
MARQLWQWCTPAIIVGAAAILAGALVEGASHADRAAVIVVGMGEICRVGVPLAVAAIALGRGLWRGWQPVIDERSGAPIVAGAGFAVVATAAVFGAGYAAIRFGMTASKLAWVSALIGAAGAAGVAALAFAVARPAVRGATSLVARLWPRGTARGALLAVAIALGVLAVAGWLVARPMLVRYDLGLAVFGAGALVGGALATVAVLRWRHARGAVAVAALAVVVIAWGAGRMVAARDPVALLDAWGQLPVMGRAIQGHHQVAALRAAVVTAIPAPVPRTDRHPDLLLITIDAWRADRLGARQADGSALTPALDALAAEAAVLARAYAPSTVTRSSLPPIMTQLSPGRLRGRLIDFARKLDPRHVLLAERIQRAGYATRGFLCCAHHFGGPFDIGLDRGLDQVVYDPSIEHLADAAAGFFADAALDGRPRFAWLHAYEPHLWAGSYPAALYGTAPGPRYDRAVATVDHALAPLLAVIRARGRPTIVVVTADHGEGLGEHGISTHAGPPYASQIHVPLVIHAPGVAPRRIDRVVGLIGLGDTLLELAGFTPPPSDGMSLASLLVGEGAGVASSGAAGVAGAGEAYSAVFHDRVIPFTAHSIVVGDHHLIEIEGRPPVLYDLARDPQELTDLAAR